MSTKSIRNCLYAVCAVALVMPPAVNAQIEEVIVTARKREESLQEVPVSVTVFSAVDIAARSLSNMKELGQMTPNLNWTQHSSRGASAGQLFIRGVGQVDPRSFWDPGVGMYIDGVYVSRMQGLDMDLVELERIEVLRGPQGTLFGKNTIGGAINVISAKPGDEFSGLAEVTVGRFDRIDAKGSVDIPIAPGKLSVKLSAAARNRDGYGSRLAFPSGLKIDETGDVDRLSGRALINWTPSDTVDFLISIDSTKIREKTMVGKNVAYNPNTGLVRLLNILADPQVSDVFLTSSNYSSYATQGNKRHLDDWGLALTANWNFGTWGVKSITSYRDLDSLNDIEPDGTPYSLLNNKNTVKQDQFTQELQLSSASFDDRLEWVLGLYYFEESGTEEEKLDVFTELTTYPAIPGTPLPLDARFIRFYTIDNESVAIFGQATYSVTDKLSFTGGLRYTRDDKKVSRQQTRQDGAVLVALAFRDDSWSEPSGMAGIEYQWNEDIMTYFSASRGFKSGGMDGSSRTDETFVSFDPEFIWSYELGIKSQWYDNRLRFNAAAFFSDYTDMQFTVVRASSLGEPIRIIGNAAAAEIKGFEIETVLQPTSGLTLQAGIGYTDATYTKVDPSIGITSDTKFNSVPKWTVMLAGEYAAPLKAWGELIGRVDYAYKSRANFDSFNSPFLWQESYGLVNARLTLRPNGGNWSVSVFGTNLTDEEYFLGGTDLFNNLGVALQQFMRPREWGISVDYKF